MVEHQNTERGGSIDRILERDALRERINAERKKDRE